MPVSRRIFLLSPLALFGCRKKRQAKVGNKPSRKLTPQQRLDRYAAGLEKEGVINRADLLGGRVVFASEFSRTGYRAYGKDKLLMAVARSNRPYTYKAYLGPGMIDKIYVVIPDSYISYIKNPKYHAVLRAFLFHEFVHVNDRSDMGMVEKTSLLVLNKHKIDSPEMARRFFLRIGHALSELKANFKMRDFIERDKIKFNDSPLSLEDVSDKHLISWMRAVNKWMLMVLQNYPEALEDVKKVCIGYIRKEFYASSSETKVAVNRVLKKENIPQIE